MPALIVGYMEGHRVESISLSGVLAALQVDIHQLQGFVTPRQLEEVVRELCLSGTFRLVEDGSGKTLLALPNPDSSSDSIAEWASKNEEVVGQDDLEEVPKWLHALQQKILTAASVVFARRPDVMELELPLVVGAVAKELRGWRDVPLHVVSGLVMGLGTREGYRVTSNSTGSRGWVIRLPTPQELISMLAKDRGFFQTVVGADLHLHVVSTFGKAGFKGFAELVKKLADEDGDDQELDKEPLVDEYIRSMAEAVAERVARMENTGPKVTSVMLAIPPPSTASTAPADSTASRVASLMAPVLSNLLDKRPVIVSRAYRRQPLPSSSHALSGRKHMDRKCQMLAEGLQHVVPFEIDPEAGQALFLVDDSVESGATAAAFIVACRMRLGADLEVDFWGPARFGGTAAVSLGYEALDRGARVHLPGGFSALLRGLEGQGLSPAAGQLMKEIDDGFRRVQQADPDHRQVSRYVVGKRMVAELLASIPSVARFLGLLREEAPPHSGESGGRICGSGVGTPPAKEALSSTSPPRS